MIMDKSRRSSMDKGSESGCLNNNNGENETIPMTQHSGYYYTTNFLCSNDNRYSTPYQPEMIRLSSMEQLSPPPFIIPMPRNQQLTPKSMPPFDKCPIIFSLLSFCFCPITCCCSIPAFVFSICSYVDHRVRDVDRYRINSDHAKRLIIVACTVGLLLVVFWFIFMFLYKDHILRIISDHIKT